MKCGLDEECGVYSHQSCGEFCETALDDLIMKLISTKLESWGKTRRHFYKHAKEHGN